MCRDQEDWRPAPRVEMRNQNDRERRGSTKEKQKRFVNICSVKPTMDEKTADGMVW